MSNENNTLLVGKQIKKKKKKQEQQQPAFVPRPQRPNRTILQLPPPKFQAPHHQQESMVELSDDTSPNTPLATTSGAWKPLGSQSADNVNNTTPVKNKPAEIKITPTRQEKWLKFKESLEGKNIHKIGLAKQSKDTDSPSEQKDMDPSGEREVKWELNTLDENEEPVQEQSKPEVVEGTASQIKLFQTKQSEKPKIVVDKKATPEPAKKVQTRKPVENVPPSFKAAKPQYYSDDGVVWRKIKPNTTPKEHEWLKEQWPNTKASQKSGMGARNERGKVPAGNSGTFPAPISYPKGIPRSFLIQQAQAGAMQPQQNEPITNQHMQKQGFDSGPGIQNPTRFDMEQTPKSRFDMGPGQMATNPEGPGSQAQSGLLTENTEEVPHYSPTDVYGDLGLSMQDREGSESSDGHGQKRLSAFQRLGPPKKQKLTINLLCNKDVREVLDKEEEEEEKFTPVHLRKDIINSNNEIVMKYLPFWPWRKNMPIFKTVTARHSKTVMILEQEQMEEAYEKEQNFIKVSVKGYPPNWKKEEVLDLILDNVKGKSFIPCFTEMTEDECKFLILRCRPGLVKLHKLGFVVRQDNVELQISISETGFTLSHANFVPRLVLRKLLSFGYDGERKLNLSDFSTKSEISHFIYYPLNRVFNQNELIQLQSTVAWDFLTDLDLSHNRITSIEGFVLTKTTPRLKHLDLSYNSLDKVTLLLRIRELSLHSIKLEGNPLCHDYTDPAHYVKVIKMIFPSVMEIDGIPIHLKGDFPKFKKNFCPSDAHLVASKFLETFFPLLEAPTDERARIENMYDEKAVLTVTYRYNLRYSTLHRKFRNIFMRARVFAEGDTEAVVGAAAIARLLGKWPDMLHDAHNFTTDVLLHNENTTILRVGGILKLIPETLAEDEYLLAFSRTVVLSTTDGVEYKIMNELVHWDEPCKELANAAFHMNTIRISKRVSLKLDSTPDEDLKGKLVEVFMKITDLDRKMSERCLELKEWNLKTALEYFMKLVKLDELDSLLHTTGED